VIRLAVAVLVALTPLTAVARAAADTLDVAITANVDAPLRAASRVFAARKGSEVRVQPHLEGRIVTDLRARADDPDVIVAHQQAIERLVANGALAPETIVRLFETDVVLIGSATGAVPYLESLVDIEVSTDPKAAASIALPDSIDPTYELARGLLEGEGVWHDLRPYALVVSDSRAALAAVESGAAAFAFVPRAAARNTKDVRVVWSPADPSAARLTYSVALFVRSLRRPEAAELYRFLMSPPARRLYEYNGFDLTQ
jgi:molybdate transport system substrate-binding protein